MKFELQGEARFKFTTTQAHLDVLMKLAQKHYDARCRSTAADRRDPNDWACGIIPSWKRTLEFDCPIYASESELDILQKVMEYARGLLDEDELKLRNELQRAFSGVRREYHKLYDVWRVEIDTEEH